VDRDSIDRIRSATFPVARRGYEKREVDRFLNRIAEWLETGGADQTRAELVRRDLERIGEQTGKILTDAHDAGEEIRAEAEREAEGIIAEAETQAERVRAAAAESRARAEDEAQETLSRANSEATRIIEDANRRRRDIEAVISDLEARRDGVVADLEQLSSEIAGAATQHRAAGTETTAGSPTQTAGEAS
jgi:DivIVA domain-containing protein